MNPKFKKNQKSIPVFVRDTRTGKLDFFDTMREAAAYLKTSICTVSNAINGNRKSLLFRNRYLFSTDYVGSLMLVRKTPKGA